MKKLILLFFVFLVIPKVLAGGVGYVNYTKVANEYHYAKVVLREVETKNNEIQEYLLKKEEEFNSIESPIQKKKFEETVRTEMEAKEKAFNDYRIKKEEDIYNRIHAVTEKIRLEKGYDAILDFRSVFSGGEDITELLINKLNAAK